MRPAEKLLWAGTPHLRTSSIMCYFFVWMVLLIVPVFILVEMVEDVGGWIAFAWAFVSVFIFVPIVSRSSRCVFALTTTRAFTSERTMFCSTNTRQVRYEDVSDAKLKINSIPSNRNATLSPDAPKFSEMKLIDYDTPRWGSPAERSRLLKKFDAEVKSQPR